MAGYLEITDSEVAAYAPISERLMTKIRDNIRASSVCHFPIPLSTTDVTWTDPGEDGVWKTVRTFKVWVPEHNAVRGCRLYWAFQVSGVSGGGQIYCRMKSPTTTGDQNIVATDPQWTEVVVDHDTTAGGIYSYDLEAQGNTAGANITWRFESLGDYSGAIIQQGEIGGWAI